MTNAHSYRIVSLVMTISRRFGNYCVLSCPIYIPQTYVYISHILYSAFNIKKYNGIYLKKTLREGETF